MFNLPLPVSWRGPRDWTCSAAWPASRIRWPSPRRPYMPRSCSAAHHAEASSGRGQDRQPGYVYTGDPELTLRQAEDAACAVRNTTQQRDFRPFRDIFDRYPQDQALAANLLTPNRQLWLTRDSYLTRCEPGLPDYKSWTNRACCRTDAVPLAAMFPKALRFNSPLRPACRVDASLAGELLIAGCSK